MEIAIMSKPRLPLALAANGFSVTPESTARRENIARSLDAAQLVAFLRDGETKRAREKRLRTVGKAE